MANLAVLHVSRSHRRQGVGSRLAEEVARLARADGARRLYVSATPSGAAVGSYRSHGFEPTDEPDEALFRLVVSEEHGFTRVDQDEQPAAWIECLDTLHAEPF
jgi:ribosomal protein S18 acetylase RimI-like enzyme